MKLEGSCHCGRIRFLVNSKTPYPYRRCYCERCRKTNGGSAYAVNVMGENSTLKVFGGEHMEIYEPVDEPLESYFCRYCGSHLYIFLPDWPQWVYPFASALDTPLPKPPETFHIFLDEAVSWIDIPGGENDFHFPENTGESMLSWHQRLELIDEDI